MHFCADSQKENKVGMWSTLINGVAGRAPDRLRPCKRDVVVPAGTGKLRLLTGAVPVAGQ